MREGTRRSARTSGLLLGFLIAAALPASSWAAPARDLGGGELIGAQIDPITAPALCPKIRKDGSRSVTVFLTRGVIERDDGSLNRAGIDNRVIPDLSCGLDVAVRVRPTTQADQDSFLPSGEELSSYLNLLTQLAAYLDGRVQRYAIDNEAAAASHFTGTAADYFALVRASAGAIRAGDPDAEILDGTMASGNMSAVMVADLYAKGRYAEATALAQETQANELGGGPPVTDMASLTAYVQSSRVQRSIQFFDGAVANQDFFDALQLHYYGPWRSLPNMFDFVRAHGIRLPVEVWEVAHRYRDGRPFTESEHADESARVLITAVGEGSPWTVFTSYLGSEANDDIGLLTFDGSADHRARSTYRTSVGELTGATSAERLDLHKDAWGYRFERPAGEVIAAWSDPEPTKAGEDLGIDASTAAVTTAGVDGVRHVRLKGLTLGGTPRFIEPDLLELTQLGGRAKHHRLHLRIDCPPAAAKPSCRGALEILGHSSGRERTRGSRGNDVLARIPYRVHRGGRKKLKIRGGGRPSEAVATAKSCPVGGKHACRSWTELR